MGAYFDNNSTTSLDPRVLDAMLPALGEHHGNPSSVHRWGRDARHLVETARQQVASLVGGHPREIVFTASGTESNNTVVAAIGRASGFRGHLVTTSLEHTSVTSAVERLRQSGMEATAVSPGRDGVIFPESMAAALRPDTRLVATMLANNEVGTIQPVAEVAVLCQEKGIPILCDAAQAVGKIPVRADELGVDFLTIAGHKFHAPLGSAALWVREGAELEALLVGAPQEGGRRASTENVPAIVGLGKAAELAADELTKRHRLLLALREHFENGLGTIPGAIVHAKDSPRLPHTTNVAFLGIRGHELMLRLARRDYAVSIGAACHSGDPKPSRVLLQMGIGEPEALASLRVSFGIFNTRSEVEDFLEVLEEEVAGLAQKV